jgi:hypothetical protein
MSEKEPYLRWHPAIPDPHGTFRSGDTIPARLNELTLEVLYEEALYERFCRSCSKD